MSTWSRLAGTLLCPLLFQGCGSSGPELADVSGVVRMDGQPLAEAFLTFTPESGRPSFGGTDANGRYELAYTDAKTGALPGQHTVKISTRRTADAESGVKAAPERVPVQYNRKTELKKQVELGSNTIDFELSSKDGKVVQPPR